MSQTSSYSFNTSRFLSFMVLVVVASQSTAAHFKFRSRFWWLGKLGSGAANGSSSIGSGAATNLGVGLDKVSSSMGAGAATSLGVGLDKGSNSIGAGAAIEQKRKTMSTGQTDDSSWRQ